MKRYGRSWSFKLIRDEIENPCEISYLSVNQLYAYLLYRLTICWSKVLFFSRHFTHPVLFVQLSRHGLYDCCPKSSRLPGCTYDHLSLHGSGL